MHAVLAAAFVAVTIPADLVAQGWIVPRECATPRCPPGAPCAVPPCPPWGASNIVRTASHVRADLQNRVLRYEVEETFVNRGEEKRVVVRFQTVAEREGDAVRIDYFRGSRAEGGVGPQPVVRRQEEGDGRRGPEGRLTFTLTYPTSE